MSLFAVYLLIAFFLLTATGFNGYYSGNKAAFYRVFLGCALSWALWHLYVFGIVTSDRPGTFFGWSLIGVARFAALPLSLHLLLRSTGDRDTDDFSKLVTVVYVSAGAIMLLQVVTIVNWLEPVRDHAGWLLNRENRVAGSITAVWEALVGGLAILLSLRRFFSSGASLRSSPGSIAGVTLVIVATGGIFGSLELLSGRVTGISVLGVSVAGAGCVLVGSRRRFSPDRIVAVAEDVLGAIPDALLIASTEGIIQRVNPKAEIMTGYDTVSAIGMHIDRLFEPGFAEALFERTLRSEKNIWTQESLLRTQSGKEIPVVINLSLVRKTRKKLPVAMVISCHDSSFEKMALDEFRKTEQLEALGFLAGGIAHDFNNLLTSIVAYLSLARTTETISDSLSDKLDKVDSAARMVIDLNRQLAAISKGSRPNKEHCSLRDLLTSAVQLSLSGSSIECRTDIPEDLHAIEADTTQINQVFLNLLVNARQAMEHGGVIGIRCANIAMEGSAWVEVEITDQGCGIPEEKLDEIFKPFYTTKKQGTGLGLSVVKSVVEKHGGTVTVVSRRGVGTTFTIRLPSFEKAPEGTVDRNAIPDRAVCTRPGKILVMDDEEGVKRALTLILEEKGHTVQAVDHGAAAITAYLKHRSEGTPFDLLLLDVTVRNGYGAREVIKRLREINPGVAAIVMSGYGENDLMKEYRNYGFCGVIEKPFDSERIYQVVNTALAAQRTPSA